MSRQNIGIPFSRFALTLFFVALAFWSHPSSADVPPVDEHRDIIFGEHDAPHTLLIYLSPGCTHCLRLQRQLIPDLVRNHVVDGELRLVYRFLPLLISFKTEDDVTADEHARAMLTSRLLAGGLRCSYETKGVIAFLESLTHLVTLHATGEMSNVQPDFQWPYGSPETSTALWERFLEGSPIDSDTYNACVSGDSAARMLSIFEENKSGFESAGYTDIPALFLNGELISLQPGFAAAANAITRQLPSPVSDKDAAFLACRKETTSRRLGVPLGDIDGLIAGINDRFARTGNYRRRSANFWLNVAEVWQLASWNCGRH